MIARSFLFKSQFNDLNHKTAFIQITIKFHLEIKLAFSEQAFHYISKLRRNLLKTAYENFNITVKQILKF